ncbi:MAG: hypothetical protein ACJ78Q_08320, partial [Chloroflexia bacterium]
GGLIGGVLVARLSKRVKVANLIGPGLFMLGLFDMAVFNVPILAFDLLMFALAGPPVIALQTGAQTLLQTNVEDRFMGRVFGAFGTTLSLAILMGQAIASVVGQAIGPAALMTIGGSIMAAMGLAAIPLLGRLTEQAPVPARSGLEVPEA